MVLEATKQFSPLLVTLSSTLEELPQNLSADTAGLLQFYKTCIDTLSPHVAGFVVDMAHCERLGPEGYAVFWLTCQHAKQAGKIVIADTNRSGTPHMSAAYAEAYLYRSSAIDAVTVNPYFGIDSITPFVTLAAAHDKGVFVHLKSSNPSSMDIQDQPVGDELLHEYIAQILESMGAQYIGPQTHLSCVGAVIATPYKEERSYLRTLMPHLPFLLTDFEELEDASDIQTGFIPNGTGALIVLKHVIHASRSSNFAQASLDALLKVKAECTVQSMYTESN